VAPRDTLQRPRLFFLKSPALLALQSQITSLIIWTSAVAFFAGILGAVSRSVAETQLPDSVKDQLVKFGAVDFTTARGYIGLIFLFFVVAIAFFGCSQLASIREEESEGRLETLFANPKGRTQWLAARLGLAVAGSFVIALASGLGAAAGVGIVGAGVGFGRLIEAGLNCLPASMLFLGIGALLLALFPRTGVGLSYAIIALAFVWELVGALLGVPSWMLQVSPFHQVGLMPAESFRAQQAAEMLGIGVVAAAASIAVFRRRDLAAA
jgi:ABC-2 type transport system permease protein